MPKHVSGSLPEKSGLPRSVENYLNYGAAEGTRNRKLFEAAAQCRDEGVPFEEAEHLLSERALADGLPPGEIRSAITSAYGGAKREPASRSSTASPRPERTGGGMASGARFVRARPRETSTVWDRSRPMALPERVEGGFEKLLRAAFEEGEGVVVGDTFEDEDGERKPDRGVVLSREKWIEKVNAPSRAGDFAKLHTSKHGHFIKLNPMRIDAQSKNTDADVTAFRHVLLEFDLDSEGRHIPKDRQLGAILASNLPVTAIIDSGDKSIHAWVRVDAKTATEYRERAEEVYALFGSDVDTQNVNPARYSRTPDGLRTVGGDVVRQSLLAVGVGSASWEEWKIAREIEDSGEEWTLDDLLKYDVENDPSALIGERRWLCRGSSLLVVSQSGVGKSSLQSQMKMGWATGRTDLTFGIAAVRPLRQLTIQAENDQGDVAEVIHDAIKSHDFTPAERALIQENCRWRRISNKSGDAFLSLVEALVLNFKPDICWIDPLVAYIGGDISDAETVAHFCYEGLSTISIRTGVIFAFIHHTAKPKEAKGDSTDSDLAYAGLGSSNLTNWAREVMVLTRLKTADPSDPPTFRFTATKRRTRAGMRTMPQDDDPLDVMTTSSIFLRHADDGTIRWEQCPEPEKAGDRRRPREPKPNGRPSSLSPAQKREIVEIAKAKGRMPGTLEREEIGKRFGKSGMTIFRYLKKLEDDAARLGISVEQALEVNIRESSVS